MLEPQPFALPLRYQRRTSSRSPLYVGGWSERTTDEFWREFADHWCPSPRTILIRGRR